LETLRQAADTQLQSTVDTYTQREE
jgi:chromosome segregation ATPase